MTLFPVIIAGGSGTRFWPLSRRKRPKQFLALSSERPLISETADRLSGLAARKDLFIVCGSLHATSAKKLVKGVSAKNILVEPAARNTAPAIGLAAIHVARRDPKGILLVLPSDHHVANPKGFRAALSEAAALAETGALVTIGIQPNRPETGFGYLRLGAPLRGTAREVAAFVEKPNAETAERYVSSGEYLWNGGIFVFRADRILEEFHRHMPELGRGLDEIAHHLGKSSQARVLKRVFPKLPSVSIDYGVMEKASGIAVVPGDFGWSDVGSFAALSEVRPPDSRGNVVVGKENAVLVDCDDCVVVTAKRPLALVGLREMVAVDAGDAVLIVPKNRSQDVRAVVAALEAFPSLRRYL